MLGIHQNVSGLFHDMSMKVILPKSAFISVWSHSDGGWMRTACPMNICISKACADVMKKEIKCLPSQRAKVTFQGKIPLSPLIFDEIEKI